MNVEGYPLMHRDGKSYVLDVLEIMRPACTTRLLTTLFIHDCNYNAIDTPFSSSAIFLASIFQFALFRENVSRSSFL
jgi:hypothetical protein